MHVKYLQKDEENKWDKFVARDRNATFFHQIRWKRLVEKVYPHKPYYLYIKNEDRITGILPLFCSSSVFSNKKLISLPYTVLGGICAESSDVEKALLHEAKELTRNLDGSYLE